TLLSFLPLFFLFFHSSFLLSHFFLFFFHTSFLSSFLLLLFFPFTLLYFLLPFLTFAFHALVFPSGNAFSSYSLYRLLHLIQLEPLNVETSFKLCRVGLIKDTCAMYFSFV